VHVVVGGGVNGLSLAWGLAERGAEVLVLDKGRLGGGASGIAGGIVRNFYRSEPIAELVRMSVEMFEEDPDAYGFRQVGYIAAVPAAQADDLVAIRAQHERAGYESELLGLDPYVDVAGERRPLL
jgi:methylglutamate dehydrogenase subunit A